MPPKKRKAAAASTSSSTPAKKVRIGGASDIPDLPSVSPSGRPKRTSVSQPNYDDTKRHSSRLQNAPVPAANSKPQVKRGPGRPPKVASSDTQVKNGRGRPPKAANPSTTTASKSSAVPKNASSRNVGKQAATPAPARKSGRPPKAAKQAKVQESDSESGDLNVHGAAELDGSAANMEEMETFDNDIQFWLMKAEPESRMEKGHDVKFSIDDLAAKTEPEGWDGVRNPVARNNMRAMRKGDLAFFYHSNCSTPGIAGMMRIVAEHSIDESAFDPGHPYYDPKSDRDKPKWELVHVEFVKKFDTYVTLKDLKSFSAPGGALEKMQMIKQSRLSVSSVSSTEWAFILGLAGENMSLGHGDGKGGYESDMDGEGEGDGNETVGGVSDGDGITGVSDDGEVVGVGVGAGITAAHDDVGVPVSNGGGEELQPIDSDSFSDAEN